jgi:AcrR family transcriptional regulator
MGTFYTHFASKEDLVHAFARVPLTQRFKIFPETFKTKNINAPEDLIVSLFHDFLFALGHPALYTIQRFAISQAIWGMNSGEAKDERPILLDR